MLRSENRYVKPTLAVFAWALSLAIAPFAVAHHSFAAEFDANKPIRIQGILSKIEWSNPHTYFWVDANGEAANAWACEGDSPVALMRQGFQKSTAKLHDQITIDGYAAKDGSHRLKIRRIYLNGKLNYELNGPAAETAGR